MRSMVERVTEVLDEENLSEFGESLSQMGYGKTTWDKKSGTQTRPNESVVLENDRDSEKERQRKELKTRHPNIPLRWTGRRWVLGRKKPSWKEIDSKRKKISEEIEHLEELSLRTGSIAVFLAKVKQYGNKVDQSVSRLRSLSNELKQSKDESDRNRIHGEIVKVESDVFLRLRKMSIYNSLVSGVSGLGNDRSYKLLKKLEKKRRI
jgi:hypothetical protein